MNHDLIDTDSKLFKESQSLIYDELDPVNRQMPIDH